MFVHTEKLPHVLSPQQYWDPEQHESELSRLFVSHWHVIGLVSQAPCDGDFLTRDLFGTPIQVRNFNGQFHCYLNVCPHRHSLLTNELCGNSKTLKCQYHGWEFTADGHTGKIPDAQSFRPMPGGPECLKKFACEVVGPLIFVNLSNEPSPVRDQLGKFADAIDEYPVQRWYLGDSWGYELPANWKVVAENTVESYHLECVHPKTLVRAAPEQDIEHEITPVATAMRSTIVAPQFYFRLANWLVPQLQPGLTNQYQLYHFLPNLFVIRIDAMLQVMTLMPTSPTTCQMQVWVSVLKSEKETWWTRLLTRRWARLKSSAVRKILAEDIALYPDLQKGMENSPFAGSISVREELVYALQKYVADA